MPFRKIDAIAARASDAGLDAEQLFTAALMRCGLCHDDALQMVRTADIPARELLVTQGGPSLGPLVLEEELARLLARTRQAA